MITQDQLVGYLKNAKVGELSSLITTLEDELGVKASAPQVFIPPQGEPDKPEKTEFNVILTGYSESEPKARMNVIKAVRAATGLGLREAKALVEEAPTALREGVTKEEAGELAAELREKGGLVEIQ